MRINLKPTKRKLLYPLIIHIFIYAGIIIWDLPRRRGIAEQMSPQEFRIIYILPIFTFLITYFVVCWFITRKTNVDVEWPIKHQNDSQNHRRN